MLEKLLLMPLSRAVCMTWAATLAGFIAGIWWPLELASHFRVQYCVVLLATGAILSVAGRLRWAGVAFLGAVVNLAVIVPLYLGDAPQAVGGPSIRLVSANVHRGNREYSKLIELIRSSKADAVLLIEVNRTWLGRLAALSDLFPHSVARPQEDNFGMALFSRFPLSPAVIETAADMDYPILIATPEVEGKSVTVIGAHPPPPISTDFVKMREQYVDVLAGYVSRQRGNVVVLGDLNTTSWSPLFEGFIRKTGLRDSRKGFGVQPTWPTWIPPLSIPIDHCLVSRGISVTSRCIGPRVGSDHYPLIVDVEILGP